MAAAWVSNMIAGGVQSAITPAMASAGGFVGGAVSSVGTGVNGVGENINGHIRRYGTGIQDYGNAIRDWTAADNPRTQTATNPLGLSQSIAAGKDGTVRPQLGPVVKRSNSSPAASRAVPRSTDREKKTGMSSDRKFGPGKAVAKQNSTAGAATKAKSQSPKSARTSQPPQAGKKAPTDAKANARGKVKISPESKPQNTVKTRRTARTLPARSGIEAAARRAANTVRTVG